MREALVSIAAGASQLALLETARRLGLAIVAVDRDPLAPGMQLADRAVVASTHDAAAVLAGLRELPPGLTPCAVATKSSGVPVTTCAEVAAALGLPGLNPEWAAAAAHKPGQLSMCARAGVPVPAHRRLSSRRELAAETVALPVVCKPVRTQVGKRGIRLARTVHELRAAFDAASAASDGGDVEVETYLPGHDVVLAGVFAESSFHPIALFDEDTTFIDGGDVRGLGFRMPSTLTGTPLASVLIGHARTLVEKLALGTGVMFTTFRVLPRRGSVHVLEIHFDLAGDWLADVLFPAATDFPLIETVLDVLRGRPLEPRATLTRPTVLRFVHARDLVEHGEEKLARLRSLADVRSVQIRACDPTLEAEDTRLGYVLAYGGAQTAARLDALLGRSPHLI